MKKTLKNEQGFILITSLLMLMVLLVIGIAATNTTTTELQIAGNDKAMKQNFYVAESGWNDAVQWLDTETEKGPPERINTTILDTTDTNYHIVRNYGDGVDGFLNAEFPAGTEDGVLTDQNTPYWFRVDEQGVKRVAGSGDNYRAFTYLITSNANREQEVEVRVEKILKVGY
ncbi:MAG: pilus assembly PilX N-terminal domain-containing protein [Desulfuromusa sp.]|nr:pilus assembly PilX N-terminal domain-containing protein [Desulfuromusa sp.]